MAEASGPAMRQFSAAPAELRAELETLLAGLYAAVPGLNGAVLSTVDGRLVAAHLHGGADPMRLAAITSSMVALSETLGREAKVGGSKYTVIDAHQGTLLLRRVPGARNIFVLGAIAGEGTMLGYLLHETHRAAECAGLLLRPWSEALLEKPGAT